LMLVAAPNPPISDPKKDKNKNKAKNKSAQGTLSLEQEVEDPNLRIISLEPPDELKNQLPLTDLRHKEELPPLPGPKFLPSELEEALQGPMEAVMQACAKLDRCALPTAAKIHVQTVLEQANQLVDLVHGASAPESTPEAEKNSTIDLQIMMRDIYNHAIQSGKDTDLALGWYMPPELSSIYSGNMQKIKNVLQMLVESAVRATQQGSVHFTVRQYPESKDPGYLLFTVTDTGTGIPPKVRSGLALTRAWELASACNGSLNFRSNSRGTTVHLALHLRNLDEAQPSPLDLLPLVSVCSERPEQRQNIVRLLQGLKCRVAEADNLNEAEKRHRQDPVSLFIAHDSVATPFAAPLIAQLKREASELGLPFCKILAITHTDLDWEKLGKAGFTLALLEPIDEEALQTTVQDIIDEYTQKRKEREEKIKNNKPPVLPDLFGTGQGSVPKDMDDLTNLSKLMQTFSNLGNQPNQSSQGQTPYKGSNQEYYRQTTEPKPKAQDGFAPEHLSLHAERGRRTPSTSRRDGDPDSDADPHKVEEPGTKPIPEAAPQAKAEQSADYALNAVQEHLLEPTVKSNNFSSRLYDPIDQTLQNEDLLRQLEEEIETTLEARSKLAQQNAAPKSQEEFKASNQTTDQSNPTWRELEKDILDNLDGPDKVASPYEAAPLEFPPRQEQKNLKPSLAEKDKVLNSEELSNETPAAKEKELLANDLLSRDAKETKLVQNQDLSQAQAASSEKALKAEEQVLEPKLKEIQAKKEPSSTKASPKIEPNLADANWAAKQHEQNPMTMDRGQTPKEASLDSAPSDAKLVSEPLPKAQSTEPSPKTSPDSKPISSTKATLDNWQSSDE
ncbi:MAG: HAMP domain-containing histidine kinase, partial [Desulfovibrio sp.]|nr:HAMP domain-containing histidine kinase [Desulfovibrio sp.]